MNNWNQDKKPPNDSSSPKKRSLKVDGKKASGRANIAGGRPVGARGASFKGRPSVKSLDTLLRKHGVALKPETLEKLWAYHRIIHENNTDGDLTRLRAFDTMVEKHYADCIIPGAFVKKWPNRMLDIGSGAGFPGIPLKIVHPEIHFTLCEPRNVRVDFLNSTIERLGLTNIDVFGHKVTSHSMDIPVNGIITRAFEVMDKTLLRIHNSLEVGGKAIFMKGPSLREEIQECELKGYLVESQDYYTIPNSTQERALVVLERVE